MSRTTTIELETIGGDPAPRPSIPQTPTEDTAQRKAYSISSPESPADGTETFSLPPVDRGRDAWRFLVAATLVETIVWGLPYTVGIFHQYWVTNMFPDDESTLTLAATLQTGLMYMSTAPLGPLFTAFPRQRQYIQIFGLVVSTAALIASGFATSASHLVVTMGILYPFAGALYLPCATLLYEWFQERLGLASGIMYAGTGVGGTVFPFLIDALLKRFGFKATMLAVGLGFGVLNGSALFFIKRRIPIPRATPEHSPVIKVDWSVALTRAFWLGLGVLFLTSLGNFNPTLWIPSFAETVGATKPDGTALVAIMNAASVPGNALTGWMSDRMPARVSIFISCTLSALAVLVIWGLGTSSALLIAFSVLWGLTALSFVGLWSKMITRICRDDPTMPTLIFSLFAVLRGVGNLTSGPISTQLLKTQAFKGAAGAYGSTNFGAVLAYTGATIFVGGLVGFFFPA